MAEGFFLGNDQSDPRVNPQLRQRIALALLQRQQRTPTTIGGGLTAIGEALGERRMINQVEAGDIAQQDAANKLFGVPGAGGGVRTDATPTETPPVARSLPPTALPTTGENAAGNPVYADNTDSPLDVLATPGGVPAAPPPQVGRVSLPPEKRQEFVDAVAVRSAQSGLNPVDVAKTMLYETGGTLDPNQPGPTTQWGQHRGLIQMGQPQAKQYGYNPQGSVTNAVNSSVDYLQGSGLKPGMPFADMYSTVNAGAPGRYGASDAKYGGQGTVADKVNSPSMLAYGQQAEQLMGPRAAIAAQLAKGNTQVASLNPQAGVGGPPAAVRPPAGLQVAQAPPSVPGLPKAPEKPVAPEPEGMTAEELKWTRIKNANQGNPYVAQGADEIIKNEALKRTQRDAAKKFQWEKDYEAWAKGEGATPLTPEQRKAFGIPDTVPAAMNNRGEIKYGPAGTNVTVNSGDKSQGKGDERLQEKLSESFIKTFEEGNTAGDDIKSLAEMRALAGRVGTGAGAVVKQYLGKWGIKSEGLSEIEALNAGISRLIPQQRVPGSGTSSDFDGELFKGAVIGLGKTPQGNALIFDTMEGLAKNKLARAEVAGRVVSGDLTRSDGVREMLGLQRQARDLSDRVKAHLDITGQSKTVAPAIPSDDTMRELLRNNPNHPRANEIRRHLGM